MPHPPVNIGEPFISFSQVGSTNDEARKAIQENVATHGMVFFSSNQLAGRGQRGRSWWGEPGASLAMSVLIKPDFLTVLQQFELNKALALGVWEGITALAGQDGFCIKWPNDLYWKNKKLGGMLIESVLSASGQWSWAIAGIGININQETFDPSLPNPVSLFQITGQKQDPKQVALSLCPFLGKRLAQLQTQDASRIHQQYDQLLYKKDEVAQFKTANRTFSAVVKSVTEKGELLLEGEPAAFTTGSLEWVQQDQ
ncbi:MAG: biotin--[acetyl-CoA-carboxylase] ligase [Chitinophagia bacterium]|nr:biotin--[acetyl-CoA-carboxylase] ligase [Chitinophagia bacterium]